MSTLDLKPLWFENEIVGLSVGGNNEKGEYFRNLVKKTIVQPIYHQDVIFWDMGYSTAWDYLKDYA